MSNVAGVKANTALGVRVWYVEGGVHPTRTPQYLALGKFSDDPVKNVGEETRITAPDPDHYQRDISVGSLPGEEERATFGIAVRSTSQKSILQGWKNKRCRVDFYALMGECRNPQDFTEGAEKWEYFPDGKISSFQFENFGAFGKDENNPVNEMVDATSEDFFEFLYMREEQMASALTTREIYTIDVDNGDNCEDCPEVGDKVFMTMAGASATPGTKPVLLYSKDKGENWSQQDISTLFSNENVKDAEVIGGNFVLISNTANAIHWTVVSEIFEGVNQWNDVVSGFVVNKGPNAMSVADINHVWIVGDGGYIYFTNDYKGGVTVQDAGVLTTQNYNAVSALDSKNVIAVGNSNVVSVTFNGGVTWESVTGPAVGINLGACWMWDAQTWLVGEGAGGTGKLWVTSDGGFTWSQIALPGTYSRIYKIKFVSEAEGYMSVQGGGQSYILRTITGGNKWVVLPNGRKGVALANSYLSDIAVTNQFSNLAYASGVATGGSLGFAMRISG